jgi:hypothetical protein
MNLKSGAPEHRLGTSFVSMKVTVVSTLGALLLLAGCAVNPAAPECGGSHLLFANLASFGMYGLMTCAGPQAPALAPQEVARCIDEGGDPAACRAVVYGAYSPFPGRAAPTAIVTSPRSSTVWRVWYGAPDPSHPAVASQIVRASAPECSRELANMNQAFSSPSCPASRAECDAAVLMLSNARCVPEQTH